PPPPPTPFPYTTLFRSRPRLGQPPAQPLDPPGRRRDLLLGQADVHNGPARGVPWHGRVVANPGLPVDLGALARGMRRRVLFTAGDRKSTRLNSSHRTIS